jgi:hypothetical protein
MSPLSSQLEVNEDLHQNGWSAAQRHARIKGVGVEAEKPRMLRMRGWVPLPAL